jgi:hypothetical protein
MEPTVNSVTISTRNKSVTLTKEGAGSVAPLRMAETMPEPAGGRNLVIDGNPDDPAWVPSEGDFEAADDEFLSDNHLERVGKALIASRMGINTGHARVIYRWKEKGGASNGKNVLGKCVKLSGPAKHFGNAEYLVWLAADHCRVLGLTEWELEALLFHELMHVEEGEDDEGNPTYKVRGHDAELFVAEFRHYGLWRPELERVSEAVKQIPLDLR